MKKYLILILLLCPCIIFASTYSESETLKDNYYINDKFYNKEFISWNEYKITKVNGYSYLISSIPYWTNTQEDKNSQYVISIKNYSLSINESISTRICVYVKNDIEVSGKGTYNSPWIIE